MAVFRNAQDIKRDALSRAGELTDGTSDYDSDALKYINDAYHGLFAGGSEFGVDIDEMWAWAKSKYPVILTLDPAEETGTITLVLGSRDGTFSIAHATSQVGRYLKIDNRDEYFKIVAHAPGATAFELDQAYTEASGTFNFKSIPLDYELSQDVIIIDEYNNKLDFGDAASGEFTATLSYGSYSPAELATHIQTQMGAVGGQSYAVSFNTQKRTFSISTDGTNLFLDFASGSNVAISVASSIGYDIANLSGATSQEAQNPINAIYRIFGPMQTFRDIDPNMYFFEGVNASYGGYSPSVNTDQGKIYATDFMSLVQDYPLTHLIQGTPDRFAIVNQKDNGILNLRFNRYPSKKTRVVVEVIEVPHDLKDNTASIPLVPRAFRSYLSHAAAHYLMLDKSDNRSNTEFQLAQAKLRGLINYNRTTLKIAGQNFGRVIPRRL